MRVSSKLILEYKGKNKSYDDNIQTYRDPNDISKSEVSFKDNSEQICEDDSDCKLSSYAPSERTKSMISKILFRILPKRRAQKRRTRPSLCRR